MYAATDAGFGLVCRVLPPKIALLEVFASVWGSLFRTYASSASSIHAPVVSLMILRDPKQQGYMFLPAP